MRNEKGFTLIELLIVVAMILILAALAIPSLLRSRIAANEASAVASLHAINTAQATYAATYSSTGFASTLAQLGPGGATCKTPSATAACLLDPGVADATGPGNAKSGYYFAMQAGTTQGGNQVVQFTIGAAPSSFNRSGVRNFCMNEDGVIHYNDPNGQSAPQTDHATCESWPRL
jgi:type IV pilus assembly protein PilA